MYVSWHFSENLVDILRVMATAKQMATARFSRWFYFHLCSHLTLFSQTVSSTCYETLREYKELLMSEIVSRGNLNQILIRMIINPPASLSWCTALPPRRHLRYCSSPPLRSQALHHQPPRCPPLRKAHKLWRLVRLGWWTVTYLSDTALSLKIHLVVGSLEESQLRKKLLQSVLQGLSFAQFGRKPTSRGSSRSWPSLPRRLFWPSILV